MHTPHGLSLIYGYTGSTYYNEIASNLSEYDVGILIGVAFTFAGFTFKKFLAVPFICGRPMFMKAHQQQ